MPRKERANKKKGDRWQDLFPELLPFDCVAVFFLGPNQRQRNCFCGRRRLLQGEQRHRFCCQCGERAPLDAPSCPDDLAKCPRHEEPVRDLVGARRNIELNAGLKVFQVYLVLKRWMS